MSAWLLEVSSGTGPVETRRFVASLATQLAGRCEQWGIEVAASVVRGDEVAPLSVTMTVLGDAERWLIDEVGTHLLIHRSTERGRSSRKRWFAAVSLRAAAPDVPCHHTLSRADLAITTCRAGGPGGQHVNKVSTAVRVAHAGSGLSVRVASERSQKANVAKAIHRLEAALDRIERDDREVAGARARDGHRQLVRGNPVRAYRLTAAGVLEADPL